MSTLLSIETMARYPFTSTAKSYISSLRLNLEDLGDPSYTEVHLRAKERVFEAIERAGRSYELGDSRALMHPDLEVELLSFPVSLFLVASLEDDLAIRRFALAEAVRSEAFLKVEKAEVLGMLAREEFKIDFKTIGKKLEREYAFAVYLKDYLREASRFNASEWKVVNRYVEGGYVYVTQRELARLMRNVIERYIVERLKEVGRTRPPEYMLQTIKELRDALLSRKYKQEGMVADRSPESWPPCMRAIYSSLQRGEGVSHFANFAFASFLLNMGMGVDEIISMYANRSDFDERLARYQVEHIAGMRGSRTRYTTPSCSTMQTNGLCIEQGRLCGGVKNPLSYVKRKMWRLREEKTDGT